MRNSRTPSARPAKDAPLTVQLQRAREANLIRLMDIARERGMPAAMEEWHRGLAEKRSKKAQSSPPAEPETKRGTQ